MARRKKKRSRRRSYRKKRRSGPRTKSISSAAAPVLVGADMAFDGSIGTTVYDRTKAVIDGSGTLDYLGKGVKEVALKPKNYRGLLLPIGVKVGRKIPLLGSVIRAGDGALRDMTGKKWRL